MVIRKLDNYDKLHNNTMDLEFGSFAYDKHSKTKSNKYMDLTLYNPMCYLSETVAALNVSALISPL